MDSQPAASPAASPAPEHCRVDLCTAQAEWMRSRYPCAQEWPREIVDAWFARHGATFADAIRTLAGSTDPVAPLAAARQSS